MSETLMVGESDEDSPPMSNQPPFSIMSFTMVAPSRGGVSRSRRRASSPSW